MTRQPAIYLRSSFTMTANAKPHLEFHRAQPVHPFHIPMAFGTIEPRPFDMGDVVEKNEVGDPVNTHPGNGFFRFVVLLFFEDLRVHGNNIVMTKETFFHGRNAGIRGPFHEGMTEATVDLFLPCMDPVTEINWLLRTNISLGIEVYKI